MVTLLWSGSESPRPGENFQDTVVVFSLRRSGPLPWQPFPDAFDSTPRRLVPLGLGFYPDSCFLPVPEHLKGGGPEFQSIPRPCLEARLSAALL